MEFQHVFLLGALALWIYLSFTAIDLWEGIRATLSNQSLPTYFELFPRKLPPAYKQLLTRNDPFFRKLSPKLQKSYGSRLMKFLNDKEFEMRDGLRLTDEMRLLIGSAAIKITFGLRNYEFDLFHTIIIYKDEFFSNVSQAYVKGETNASGVIVFSWKDLKFGESISDDSLHLGYHEFAHALFLEHLMDPYESAFKEHYREWLVYLKNYDKLKEVREKQIFRDYAAVNEMEFFAVALENFF